MYDFIKEMRENERKITKSQLKISETYIKQSIDKLNNIDKELNSTVSFLINLKQNNYDKRRIK